MTTLASSLAQHGRPLLLCVAIFQFLFITVFLRDSTTTQSLSGGGSVQLRGLKIPVILISTRFV